jgi:2'-hydroxyisoflavone reductase
MTVTMQQVMKNVEVMYGAMKTASEREAKKWFGDRTTIIRPTLIAGPGDDSFRFTYWPHRIAKGGEVLAPGDGKDNVQLIDARDVAEWTIRIVESGTMGTFNAAGPKSPMTMGEQLDAIKAAVPGGKDAKLTWVPTDFLTEQKVSSWGDMPTWIPRTDPDYASANADNHKAVAAGLTFRPVGTTAVDALEWFNAASEQARTQMMKGAGIDAEREKAVLAAWHAKR